MLPAFLFVAIRLFDTCEAHCALPTENKRAAAVSTWRRMILEAKDWFWNDFGGKRLRRRNRVKEITERTNYDKQ